MNRSKGKKERQFIENYNQHFDGIYRYCYFCVFDQDLADDIVQETFIKTWKYIADGKDIKNIKPFLYKVARNLVIDHSRKKSLVPLDEVKENVLSFRLNNDSEKKMFDTMSFKELQEILKELDEDHREVVIMRYVEEFKPKEIAVLLGESANTVSVRIHNGLEKLRKILKDKSYGKQ